MEKYISIKKDNKLIFKNLLDNTELEVEHYDDEFAFDTIFINEKYDLDFIDYAIQKLKETKDVSCLYVEYDSSILEKLLYKKGFRVANYQYTIKKDDSFELSNYEISNTLKQEEKDYYLRMINKYSKDNHQYINPYQSYQEYTEKWFNNLENEKFKYRVYRKNNEIVGIVEYMNFGNEFKDEKNIKSYFDLNSKLCIRCIFGKDEKVLEDMIKDLLKVYKKDIVVTITYIEKSLKEIVNKFNSKFDFCLYVLVEK